MIENKNQNMTSKGKIATVVDAVVAPDVASAPVQEFLTTDVKRRLLGNGFDFTICYNLESGTLATGKIGRKRVYWDTDIGRDAQNIKKNFEKMNAFGDKELVALFARLAFVPDFEWCAWKNCTCTMMGSVLACNAVIRQRADGKLTLFSPDSMFCFEKFTSSDEALFHGMSGFVECLGWSIDVMRSFLFGRPSR